MLASALVACALFDVDPSAAKFPARALFLCLECPTDAVWNINQRCSKENMDAPDKIAVPLCYRPVLLYFFKIKPSVSPDIGTLLNLKFLMA
jgi:hypothetical protein